MSGHNHDHNPKQQQAQDAVPRGQLHVNGAAEGGPVSDGGKGSTGKGGGNKSPPGNGKAPPPGNGAAEGRRSLPERVAVLETEHKHLATKADLERGLRATEGRLRKEVQAVRKEVQAVRKEAQAVRKEAQKNKEGLQSEIRRMPYVILVGLAALATVVSIAPQAIDWLRGLLG